MQTLKIAGIFLLLQMQICNFHVLCMNSDHNYKRYQTKNLEKRIAKNKEIALEKINSPHNASDFFKCYGWLGIITMREEDINIDIEELVPLNFTCNEPKQSTKKKNRKKQNKTIIEETEAYVRVTRYFAYRLHERVSSIKIHCSLPSEHDKILTLQFLAKKYATKFKALDRVYTNFFTKLQQ